MMVLAGPRESDIAAGIEGAAGTAVARRCADLAEGLSVCTAGVGDVLLVSALTELDRRAVNRVAKKGIAVVGIPSSEAEHDRLLNLGIATVLPIDASTDDVVVAVREAGAEQAPEPPADEGANDVRGEVVAVWSPVGSWGSTTIAVNLATEMADAGETITLIDLDSYGASIAPMLGLSNESSGVAAVARTLISGGRALSTVDENLLFVSERLGVLTGLSRPDRWAEVPEESIAPLLEAARQRSDVVVADVGFCLEKRSQGGAGAERNDAARAVIAAADRVVAVAGADPVGVQRFVSAWPEFSSVCRSEAEIVVVANRVRSAVAGLRPREAVADVLARYAGIEEVWTVPDEPATFDAALVAGTTLTELRTHSPARAAIAAIAKHCRIPVPVHA